MQSSNVPALPASGRRIPEVLRGNTSARLRAMVALFTGIRLFQKCSRDQLDYLAATAYPMSFETGDFLCIEGTYAPVCYVVAEGRATVRIGRRVVGGIEANSIVGERGILMDTLRAATVVATAPLVACAIARDRLQILLDDSRLVREWMLEDVRRSYPAVRGVQARMIRAGHAR